MAQNTTRLSLPTEKGDPEYQTSNATDNKIGLKIRFPFQAEISMKRAVADSEIDGISDE